MGDEGDDQITGGAGNDDNRRRAGRGPESLNDSDLVQGGAGDDEIEGGFGAELLDGGAGDDASTARPATTTSPSAASPD